MKKLMIAAAIVSAAALSQAATFDWSSTAKAFAPTEIAAGTKLVNGQHYNSASSGNSNAMADLLEDGVVAWKYSILISDDAGATWSDPTVGTFTEDDFSSRKITVAGISNDKFALPTDESTKNLQWKIVITGDYVDEDGTQWTLTSDAITGNKDYTKVSAAALDTAAPSGWTATTSAVPEPTSGLLLLLGMAGLALRRRRA